MRTGSGDHTINRDASPFGRVLSTVASASSYQACVSACYRHTASPRAAVNATVGHNRAGRLDVARRAIDDAVRVAVA